ncbi:lactonase family protein [Virgibacillus halodenitrificans]|uniref:lactonase family protein n=1 Tax=Virgibacillus halodenitrificans TaxID=1482 RepID=UPI0024C05AC2|nr:lactonase family protein [Virgibacillus halodenitrificans]WHX25686.1 lactonase family protein [Virgibacillus halodenitrificans]
MLLQEDEYIVYVGTYGSEQDNTIRVLRLDPIARSLTQLEGVRGIENPSYLTVNQSQEALYAISEVKKGKVTLYEIDKPTYHLQEGNSQRGEAVEGPCYITLDEAEDYLFIVNYGGGSLSVYELASDHTIGQLLDQQTYSVGSRPHTIVQIPGTSNFVVTDLGLDRIYLYKLVKGKLMKINEIATPPGSGPRHAAVLADHKKVYIVNEFNSQLSVYSYDSSFSSMELVQKINTIDKPIGLKNYGADVHIAYGKSFLYTSNRGHDSISVFQIDKEGLLIYVDNVSSEGNWPRNFVITSDEKFLLVANQRTNSIVLMEIGADGLPIYSGEKYIIPAPVCLKTF